MRPHFRFEDLEIWHLAAELAVKFHRVAERLDQRKFYRYAEQIRAAGLSLANNIAEGSGSVHVPEFKHFLNIASGRVRRRLHAYLFSKVWGPEDDEATELLEACDKLSRISRLLSSLH